MNNLHHIPSRCPLCNGKVEPGTTTFTVDLKTGVVVVRNVPAMVCTQCGEDWIENPISIKLETIAARAKAQNTQLEMVSMAS
ncbi:MAG: type II toxin-antitoxin system MqsA family antitoxin [Bacteroidota bacterium]